MNKNNLSPIHPSDPISYEGKIPPRSLIRTDDDVLRWQHSESYSYLMLYIQRLGDSVVGTELRTSSRTNGPIGSLVTFLEEINSWADDIPPQASPQRYGNLAFRDWGQRLEQRCEGLLKSLLPDDSHEAIRFLKPYVLTSFGSFVRIDYGTGHELSFVVFLLCLHRIGVLSSEPEIEQSVVLDVFVKYLNVCWNLQDTYKLEPAGSHGVWGLDDYSFLGYVWGSAQLRDKPDTSPSIVLQQPLPDRPTDLYTLSILRVNTIKTGPFHEHSPQLYSIASSVPVWRKVNTGLMKMYEAEVLSKRVVVQHLPLGGPLMPFDEFCDSQPQTITSSFASSSYPAPLLSHAIQSHIPRAPTNLLPPLRATPRATTGTNFPGPISPFATPSGSARFTVSRAAGRGSIPGAMGGREVASPLGEMGPPPIPARLSRSPSPCQKEEKPKTQEEQAGR